MKYLTCFLLLAIVSTAAPIAELTLKDGRMLHEVEFKSFSKLSLMAKYRGGAGTIRYDQLPIEVFESIKSKIPGPTKEEIEKAESLAAIEAAQTNLVIATTEANQIAGSTKSSTAKRTINGQVFVMTRGAGAYKFGGAHVVAFPLQLRAAIRKLAGAKINAMFPKNGSYLVLNIDHERFKIWQSAITGLTPVAATSTDGDGNYSLEIPMGVPVFIYCATRRYAAGEEDFNLWAVPLADSDRLNLDVSNQF